MSAQLAKTVLEYYVDSGIDFLIGDEPIDNSVQTPKPLTATLSHPSSTLAPNHTAKPQTLLATPEAVKEAIQRANNASTLEDLAKTIREFEGLQVKHMATQMVFGQGDPNSNIMVIGDAPGADEDRSGKPFAGETGLLLDKMLAAINLGRAPSEGQTSCYLSNILNWRPPGNRTPTTQEMQICLPFIEKHIALVQPKIIILLGGVTGKTLLGTTQGITRLRSKWVDYEPQTGELNVSYAQAPKIMPTFHPDFLLRQPLKKRQAWQDLLMIKAEFDAL